MLAQALSSLMYKDSVTPKTVRQLRKHRKRVPENWALIAGRFPTGSSVSVAQFEVWPFVGPYFRARKAVLLFFRLR